MATKPNLKALKPNLKATKPNLKATKVKWKVRFLSNICFSIWSALNNDL